MSNSTQRLAAVVLAAVVVAAGAIAVSASSGDPQPRPTSIRPAAVDLAGIPEHKGVLGDPQAKITVTEFVDPQCPVCAAASRELIPGLIDRYVRTGKVKLDARVLHFLGPDSLRAARYAATAREEDRLWPFLETLYANQGEENSGWATPAFLSAIARKASVSGPPAAGPGTATAEAERLGVDATPTFVVERPGEKPQVVDAAGLGKALAR